MNNLFRQVDQQKRGDDQTKTDLGQLESDLNQVSLSIVMYDLQQSANSLGPNGPCTCRHLLSWYRKYTPDFMSRFTLNHYTPNKNLVEVGQMVSQSLSHFWVLRMSCAESQILVTHSHLTNFRWSGEPGVVKVHHIGYPWSFAIAWRKRVFLSLWRGPWIWKIGGLFEPVTPCHGLSKKDFFL